MQIRIVCVEKTKRNNLFNLNLKRHKRDTVTPVRAHHIPHVDGGSETRSSEFLPIGQRSTMVILPRSRFQGNRFILLPTGGLYTVTPLKQTAGQLYDGQCWLKSLCVSNPLKSLCSLNILNLEAAASVASKLAAAALRLWPTKMQIQMLNAGATRHCPGVSILVA